MTRAQDVDADFVAGKRGANVSWSAIARMAGCAEPDLRRRFDDGFTPDIAIRPVAPRERVRAGLVQARFAPDDAIMLARLWQANGAALTASDLTRGVIGGGAGTYLAREMKTVAVRRGVRFAALKKGYALSAEGVIAVERLAGLRS